MGMLGFTCKCDNHPFVVWSSCFLWLMSIFAICGSLFLFFCVGDMLVLTGLDVINALVLLTGIIMLPSNIYILYSIANGRKIDYKATVVCCPIWLSIIWIILVAFVGAVLCIHKIYVCQTNTYKYIVDGMRSYRSCPRYKRFMDNLQWSFKCCGLESFKDWFLRDWYDKIRDYEWDPSSKRQGKMTKDIPLVTDSVPLSCCKSGSCVSNYLMELGTSYIHTRGCRPSLYKIIMITMIVYLVMFITLIVDEILVLRFLTIHNMKKCPFSRHQMQVKPIMSVKDNFEVSSGSRQENPDEDESED